MKTPLFLAIVILAVMPLTRPGTLRAAEQNGGGRPNVLIIMCDQLNANVPSCYGGPVSTPHIDRIAREGVRFDQAVCTTATIGKQEIGGYNSHDLQGIRRFFTTREKA